MDTYPQPPTEPSTVPTRTSRWRRVAVGALAGGLLATAAGVGTLTLVDRTGTTDQAAASTTSPTTTQQRFPGARVPTYGSFGTGQDPYAAAPGQSTPSDPGTGAGTGTTQTSQETDATDAQSQGLVLIDTTLTDGAAAGTGMVLDADGLVLTNYHVVEGSTSVSVTIATTGTTYDAQVVGHDATADVALLQLDGVQQSDALTPVTLDDDGDPAVADAVTAVGNAEGQGFLSAATGTVVALDQSITTADNQVAAGESLTDLIQTNASVVGGYSGGALLDDEGEVVGITTAASSGGRVESYAVPIADALAVVDRIESGSETTSTEIGATPYLGVSIDDSLAIADVESGSPAADAGITAGSTLTALDRTPLTSRADLTDVLADHEPGDSVGVTWTDSSGATRQATPTLGSSPVN